MKKIVLTLIILLVGLVVVPQADASLVSDRSYRAQQAKEIKQDIKQIKALLKVHNDYANKHDLKMLGSLYSDNYINNDGFDKEAYFKSIEKTWESCDDLSYKTEIISIKVNGGYARVNVLETASGTVVETYQSAPIAGEIHSEATGVYHLEKINDKWYIAGDTTLTEESSLLYGDARFMNIELQTPEQVEAGNTYTVSVKVDADDKTFIMGSIEHDTMTYPTNTPKGTLRALPESQVLERLIKANSDNLNEYAVTALAISKIESKNDSTLRFYMSGLACLMRRVNVVPKNNFINLEE